MGVQTLKAATMPDAGLDGVRLSPVELRNLSIINDPALDGLHREDASDPVNVGSPAEASSVCKEDDPTLLARVQVDVLEVGADIVEIKVGPDGPIAHERVEVHPDNPFFSTDGKAIYSKDGSSLICMAVPCESYEVAAGCVRIGERAFDTVEKLARIKLPDGVVSIGRLAFAKSGLRYIDIPDSVVDLDDKAFYGCRSLVGCTLGSSLRRIGAGAFALSALERIRIPASVEEIGAEAFDRTPAMRDGHTGTISMDPANRHFEMDSHGGLYRYGAFATMLSCVESYAIRRGCEEILPEAFRRNVHLVSVGIPEGLMKIGDDAFHGCRRLIDISLPASLQWIGDRAFMDTRIVSLTLSAELRHMGESALLVGGENPVRPHRPLSSVDLDPRNERFYVEHGMLCERGAGDSGADKALLYIGPDQDVVIPDAVNRIAPYAFLGVTWIDSLSVHGHLHSICAGAFSVASSIPKIHVETSIGDSQMRAIDLPVPSLSYRYKDYSDLFTTEGGRTVFVFAYYDAWVTSTSNVAQFASSAIVRLRDPICLREDMKELYLGILDRKQEAVCAFFAQKGDIDALEDLARWGVLSGSSVKSVLDQASSFADAQAIGCLLELGRRMDRKNGLDLSI